MIAAPIGLLSLYTSSSESPEISRLPIRNVLWSPPMIAVMTVPASTTPEDVGASPTSAVRSSAVSWRGRASFFARSSFPPSYPPPSFLSPAPPRPRRAKRRGGLADPCFLLALFIFRGMVAAVFLQVALFARRFDAFCDVFQIASLQVFQLSR